MWVLYQQEECAGTQKLLPNMEFSGGFHTVISEARRENDMLDARDAAARKRGYKDAVDEFHKETSWQKQARGTYDAEFCAVRGVPNVIPAAG